MAVAIKRSTPDLAPLDLTVSLPAGAKLVGGATSETITDTRTAQVSRTLHVIIDAIPAADLVVTVDRQTTQWGVHATDQYRFGRPAPKGAQPAAEPLPGSPRGPLRSAIPIKSEH